jgi:hypothetical protein
MKLSLVLPLISSVFWATVAHADPLIQSVGGTPSDGATITLSGTGFGSVAGRQFVFDAPFAATYGGISEGKTVPTGSAYPFLSNTALRPGAVKLSGTSTRYSGAQGAFRVLGGSGYLHNPTALGGSAPPARYTELYVSYWFKPDSSIDGSSHSSKFLRIWDDDSGNGTRVSWTQMHLTYDGGKEISWANWGGTTGQWNRLEFYVNASSRQIRAWTNGELIHNVNDFQKSSAYPDIGLHLERIGFDEGGTSPPGINHSFSDVYASNSPARVELCAASTWTSCAVRELQQTTYWDDQRIELKLSLGRLTGTSPLFLYVIDSQGRVTSSGALMCSSNCASRPMPPSAVTTS